MKRVNTVLRAVWMLLFVAIVGCAEKGEEGTSGIDCGSYGSEHDGHCHCDSGYLFDGDACVLPESIEEICEDHEEHSSDTDTDHHEEDTSDMDADHHDDACVCPDEGECPCDGTIEQFGGADYCVPELHEE